MKEKLVIMKKDKIVHYVNNEDFCKALIKYKEDCKYAEDNGKSNPRIPEYIGKCFMKIAEGLSHRPNFINYTYRDEMISDGIENCLMYLKNFNLDKSNNPFAYFTQITFYAFIRRIQKEKKQVYVKYKAAENMTHFEENDYDDDLQLPQFEPYENVTSFIQNYEESIKKKKVNKSKDVENFLNE